jgi:hypothetical protein
LQAKTDRLAALAAFQALVSRDIPPFSASLNLSLFGMAMLQLAQTSDRIDQDLLLALLQTFGAVLFRLGFDCRMAVTHAGLLGWNRTAGQGRHGHYDQAVCHQLG